MFSRKKLKKTEKDALQNAVFKIPSHVLCSLLFIFKRTYSLFTLMAINKVGFIICNIVNLHYLNTV
jgi:hypothetical protein